MNVGRKNLKRAVQEEISIQEFKNIMQVVSLRGSNLIEVMDAEGGKSLALFPAKFQKSLWIKRGNFVLVDGSGREKAMESGSKVTCMVSKVLFHEQIRSLQKSPEWPEIFRTKVDSNDDSPKPPSPLEELYSSGDESLPPLEANSNRIRPFELQTTRSDSDSDS